MKSDVKGDVIVTRRKEGVFGIRVSWIHRTDLHDETIVIPDDCIDALKESLEYTFPSPIRRYNVKRSF